MTSQHSWPPEGEALACLRHGDSTIGVLTIVEPGLAELNSGNERDSSWRVAGVLAEAEAAGWERSGCGERRIGMVHRRSVVTPPIRRGLGGIPAAELGSAREDVALPHVQPRSPTAQCHDRESTSM
jgi:hypothetical protein